MYHISQGFKIIICKQQNRTRNQKKENIDVYGINIVDRFMYPFHLKHLNDLKIVNFTFDFLILLHICPQLCTLNANKQICFYLLFIFICNYLTGSSVFV